MSETPTTDKTREEIAKLILCKDWPSCTREEKWGKYFCVNNNDPNDEKNCSECSADAILAIQEIEEGQELLEKRDRLVELDDDQSMPPALYHGGDAFTEEAVKSDMVRGGFRRVKKTQGGSDGRVHA